jgi:acetylornithine/succinyldiaminopimelate/putrescine aminotransferase
MTHRVIASAAKQSIFRARGTEKMDCFAALAMTRLGQCPRRLV